MLVGVRYRRGFLCLGLLFAFLVQIVPPVSGQQDSLLTRGESQMLGALKERFLPLPSVDRIWTGAFVAASSKAASIRGSIDSIQRSGIAEEEVVVRVGALRQELRVVKNDRNTFVAGFLTPLQQLALDSILNPPAPSIQHFGFHDRLMCLVCKKPNEGAIFPSGVKSPDQLMLPKQ
jgi:hypothetical protein